MESKASWGFIVASVFNIAPERRLLRLFHSKCSLERNRSSSVLKSYNHRATWTIALMYCYVRRAYLSTKARFENVKLHNFAEMNFQGKAMELKRITTHKEKNAKKFSEKDDFRSQWHRQVGTKYPSTSNKSRTYGLLVQMLRHWATGELRELKSLNSVHVTNILHTANTGNVDSKSSIKPPPPRKLISSTFEEGRLV